MSSSTLHDGGCSTLGRLALGTLVLPVLAAYHAYVTPPLGASRAAVAAEELSDEQMNRFQILIRRGTDTGGGVLRPRDIAPSVEGGRAGPEGIGSAASDRGIGAVPSLVGRADTAARPTSEPDEIVPEPGAAYFVQLAALTNEAAVEPAWELFQREHGDILGALDRKVERIAADRGLLFHRMMVGPFASRAAAAEVCRALQQRRQDCFLRGPA